MSEGMVNSLADAAQRLASDLRGETEPASELPGHFTESERNEIITRLQVIENNLDQVVGYMTAIGDVVHGTAMDVAGVSSFCEKLAQTLDALGSNPMLGALLPPGMFAPPAVPGDTEG